MSDYTQKEVEMFGKRRQFRALSGIVINANQRSDTYVSGSGSSSSYGGYGGGSTSIGSTVVVTSNIWFRSLSGQEHRLSFKQDIPVCEGNVIHVVDVLDMQGNQISNGDALIYNSSIGEWYYTGKLTGEVRNINVGPVFWKITLGFTIAGLIWAMYFQTNNSQILYSAFLTLGLGGFFLGMFISLYYIGATIQGEKAQAQAKKQFGQYFREFYSDLDEVAKKFVAPVQQTASDIIDQKPEVAAIPQGTAKVFCTSCGSGIAENAVFCGSCGTKLAAAV